eukprot:15448278-Alexandrium_andersonii.AAC.1
MPAAAADAASALPLAERDRRGRCAGSTATRPPAQEPQSHRQRRRAGSEPTRPYFRGRWRRRRKRH